MLGASLKDEDPVTQLGVLRALSVQGVSKAHVTDPVIFNDQMGAGRTTTGMVIACMVRSMLQPGAAHTRLPVPVTLHRCHPPACRPSRQVQP